MNIQHMMDIRTLLCVIWCWTVFQDSAVARTDKGYQLMVKKATWQHALSTCGVMNWTFLPDVGQREITQYLLGQMEVGEMVWLHAKEISIKYNVKSARPSYKYVKMSYRYSQQNLSSYRCTEGDFSKRLTTGKYSWKRVNDHCSEGYGGLLSIFIPKALRDNMPLMSEGDIYWINKFTRNTLPNMVSDDTAETCLGFVKLGMTTFEYRVADCNKKFKYFCDVSDNHKHKYAPTIQRCKQKIPEYADVPGYVDIVIWTLPPNNITEATVEKEQTNTDEGSVTVVIIGSTIGGLVLMGVIIVFVVIVVKKKRHIQERYKQRSDRYRTGRQKRTTAGSLRNGETPHDGSNKTLDKNSVILGMDKGKYVHLRESKNSKYNQDEDKTAERYVDQSVPNVGQGVSEPCQGQGDAKGRNIDQPGYYLMEMGPKPSYVNKTAAIEVQTCYESYNPDPYQLNKQLNTIRDKNYSGVQVKINSDLMKSTGIKKIPMVPKKNKQVKQLADLDMYEEPVKANNGPQLPVKKIKGKVQKKNSMAPMKTDGYAQKPLDETGHYEFAKGPSLTPEGACMGLTNQIAQPCLNDLGVYESYDQDQTAGASALPTELKDLDEYENFGNVGANLGHRNDPLVKTEGNVKSLDDLDQYENFGTPPTSKKLDSSSVLLKDLDDYENLPLQL